MERAVTPVLLCWHGKGGREEAGDGGRDLKLQLPPLSFHLLRFIWRPVEFMILPPAKGCCISSHRVPSSWVIDLVSFGQLVCPLTTSKGLMSNNKLSPSNRFGKTDYLCFTSGETVSIQSKAL